MQSFSLLNLMWFNSWFMVTIAFWPCIFTGVNCIDQVDLYVLSWNGNSFLKYLVCSSICFLQEQRAILENETLRKQAYSILLANADFSF